MTFPIWWENHKNYILVPNHQLDNTYVYIYSIIIVSYTIVINYSIIHYCYVPNHQPVTKWFSIILLPIYYYNYNPQPTEVDRTLRSRTWTTSSPSVSSGSLDLAWRPGFDEGRSTEVTHEKLWTPLLVGGKTTPLKNMSSSVGMMKFPTEWKVINNHVPNHQPVWRICENMVTSLWNTYVSRDFGWN